MSDVVKAPYPIRIPYTLLFMSLRKAANALIEQMEQETARVLPPSDRQFVTEEWQAYEPGLIIASIDWEQARLIFRWCDDDKSPQRDASSPFPILDLSELKQFALASDRPRACFDSYALHVLSVAHDYLGEFFRDGPTDDIPYYRHNIVAEGPDCIRETDGDDAQIWISNVLFTWDDHNKR